MKSVTSQGQAGQVIPMIAGTPRQWAIVTAGQIMEAASDATPDALRMIMALRQRAIERLIVAFTVQRLTPQQVEATAQAATSALVTISQPTPWALNFSEPSIRQAIKDKIAQNLVSACGVN